MSTLAQIKSLQLNQNTGQYLRIEQSNLMAMSSAELDSLIREIENNELFGRLFRDERIVRYKRFDKSDICIRRFMPDESKLIDNRTPDVESLLLKNSNIIEHIRKLGFEKFKKYFLLPEECFTENEIAANCGIPVSQVESINSIINDVAVLDEFYTASSINNGDVEYMKIASIEKNNGGFVIAYFSTLIAKGKYLIDYEKFENSLSRISSNKEEIKNARNLLKKLEMINVCKETLHRIISNIVKKQSAYIESGDLNGLLPLSQKEMAVKLGINPSTLSRAIKCRTIELPCGREVTIKSLFPNPRKFKSLVLKKVMESEEGMNSDAGIQARLSEKYGINISRRSVADIRKELRIPAGRTR
ncbi:MAG: hypothetical protein ACOWWO_15985 [Peptococcaceae bacterium]